MNPTESTLTNLRRRLACRFSIIGPENKFAVEVNSDAIRVTDRDFYPKIEYLWSLGNVGDKYEKLCTKAKNKQKISGDIDAANRWVVTGWVGTVDEQKSIDEETNIIPVLAWGKLIHEDLLSAVKRRVSTRSTSWARSMRTSSTPTTRTTSPRAIVRV